jgi:hypothetical protein
MAQSFRSAADVLELLEKRAGSKGAIDENKKQLYRQAAAVLVSLKEPDALQPVGGNGVPKEGREALSDELIPATGRKFEGMLMLHPDSRRAAIAQLPTVDARQKALAANPKERGGSLQRQLERYLLHSATPLEEQPPEQLDETFQIVTWLEGALDGLPSSRDVQARLSLRSFSAPFEALAGDDIFRGRTRELDYLRSYIGVLEPAALLQRLANRVLRWTKPVAQPALSISGPGGVGKSALVARFMLEHSRLASDARLPFAYLDFDRSVLNISEPGTLLGEMLNQLDMQFEREGYFRELRDSFIEWMGTGERQEGQSTKEYDARVRSVIADLVGLIEVRLGPRPYVIVLDTFEEVQYRGERQAFGFWELLDRMQQARSFLRVVIAGRAPVNSLVLAKQPPQRLELGELDREAAIAFLQTQGISDASIAEALVKQMGGVPLSLKLAASVVKRQGFSSVSDISGRSTFWFSTSDEVIQGFLYSRILGHLHDPSLERLAHPGLVLRRISPPIILEVLNEPCELGISTMEEAQDLFDKLRRETALVSSDTLDGTLVHRPDLRRTMLKLLVEKMPERAKQIHQAAAKWYAAQTGWKAKAEELYHRLSLEELPNDPLLEHPDVHSSLQSSISELAPNAQRFLSTHGYDIDPEILEQASKEERDLALAAEIEELLPYGPRSVSYAKDLFHRKAQLGHAGPLYYSGARIFGQEGQDFLAADLISTGLELTFKAMHSHEVLALLSEQAWLRRRNPELGDMQSTLPTLEEYARRHDSFKVLLQHRVQKYEVSLRSSGPPSQEQPPLLRDIAELLKRLTTQELWAVFPLLENVIDAVGEDSQAHLLSLVHNEESPFLRVQFVTREAQAAVEELTMAHDVSRFVPFVKELCKVWPYRILSVKPPYSSASFGSESAAR